MAIRVTVERRVREGSQNEMMIILQELRTLALPGRGYISWETLRSKDDLSTQYCISTWQSVEDWVGWRNHPERNEVSKRLE